MLIVDLSVTRACYAASLRAAGRLSLVGFLRKISTFRLPTQFIYIGQVYATHNLCLSNCSKQPQYLLMSTLKVRAGSQRPSPEKQAACNQGRLLLMKPHPSSPYCPPVCCRYFACISISCRSYLLSNCFHLRSPVPVRVVDQFCISLEAMR